MIMIERMQLLKDRQSRLEMAVAWLFPNKLDVRHWGK